MKVTQTAAGSSSGRRGRSHGTETGRYNGRLNITNRKGKKKKKRDNRIRRDRPSLLTPTVPGGAQQQKQEQPAAKPSQKH